jgi:8-oxo-dGTP diphosphatase
MRGDGDGWVNCLLGHRHWGKHGAAGLLLYTVTDGEAFVLLQHRAPWCHHGDTWGIPGGARDSHETTVQAALREAAEEAGIDGEKVTIHRETIDDHGDWSYTTVVGHAPEQLATSANAESLELRWQRLADTGGLELHPGFGGTWPSVRAEPVRLLIDLANVVGSRPDGWWRDRAGASTRMLAEIGRLTGGMVSLPSGRDGVVTQITAVTEGQARAATAPSSVRVVPAEGSGDDTLVTVAHEQDDLVVVTADRGLAARLPPTAKVVGPSWLRDQLGRG